MGGDLNDLGEFPSATSFVADVVHASRTNTRLLPWQLRLLSAGSRQEPCLHSTRRPQ